MFGQKREELCGDCMKEIHHLLCFICTGSQRLTCSISWLQNIGSRLIIVPTRKRRRRCSLNQLGGCKWWMGKLSHTAFHTQKTRTVVCSSQIGKVQNKQGNTGQVGWILWRMEKLPFLSLSSVQDNMCMQTTVRPISIELIHSQFGIKYSLGIFLKILT